MEPIRSQDGLGPFAEALAIVKRAKNVFWWILLVCLVVQLAGFVMVRFTHYVCSPATPAAATVAKRANAVATTAPTSEPAAATATAAEAAASTMPSVQERPWYHVFRYALPGTLFLCVIVGLLLILTLMWMVKLALLARTVGVEGYMSAFFWALVFWVLVIPWQRVLHADLLVGATFDLNELIRRTNEIIYSGSGGRLAEVFYYCRFAAYPVIALVILGIVQSKFSAGYKRMTYSATSNGTMTQPPAATKL